MSESDKKTPTVSQDQGATSETATSIPKELESEWLQFLKKRKDDKEYSEMVSYYNKQAEEIEVPTLDPLFHIGMYIKRIQEEVRALDEYIQQSKDADKKEKNKMPFPAPVQTYNFRSERDCIKYLGSRLFMFRTWIIRQRNTVWVHKLTDIVTSLWLEIIKLDKEWFKVILVCGNVETF